MELERYCLDYQDLPLEGNCIGYYDIPYKNSNCGSYSGFDHDRFYEWALKQTVPIYISEYWMPDDFVMVKGIKKRQLSSRNGATALVTEGIWVPRKVAEEMHMGEYEQMSIFDFLGE